MTHSSCTTDSWSQRGILTAPHRTRKCGSCRCAYPKAQTGVCVCVCVKAAARLAFVSHIYFVSHYYYDGPTYGA